MSHAQQPQCPPSQHAQHASNESACSGCPQADACRDVWSQPRRGPFNPVGLSISSGLAFLLPVMTAIVAIVLAHPFAPPEARFSLIEAAAGLGGLFVGVVVAMLIIPFVKRRFHNRNLPNETGGSGASHSSDVNTNESTPQ